MHEVIFETMSSLIPVKIPEGIFEGIPGKVLNESQEEYLKKFLKE